MLLDMQMPKKSGIQVVQEVRALYKTLRQNYPDCDVIEPEYVFLTAFSTNVLKKHLASQNITHVYEKPISFELLQKLMKMCHSDAQEQDAVRGDSEIIELLN